MSHALVVLWTGSTGLGEVVWARESVENIDSATSDTAEWPTRVGMSMAAAGTALLLYAGLAEEGPPAIVGGTVFTLGLTVMFVWAPGLHAAEVQWASPQVRKTPTGALHFAA